MELPIEIYKYLNETWSVFNRMEMIFGKRYDLTKQDKIKILDEVLKNFDIKDKTIKAK